MNFNFPAFTLVFFAGGIICLVTASVLWNRRPAPGIVPLFLLSIAGAVWTLGGALEAGAVELSNKILFSKIAYWGVVSTGVFWLVFTLDYSGSTWWKRPRNFVLLSIIPLVTLVLAWTNDYHGWLWSRIYLSAAPLGPATIWEHGPWYLVNPLYQYCLCAWGIFILCRFALRRPRYQKQVVILLIATALLVIGSILFVMGIKPAEGYDLSPFYISIAAVIYSITIFRFRLVNVLPLAYKALVRSIPDGVLILDTGRNILEMNPAAEKLIGQSEYSAQGKALAGIWPELDRIITASKIISHAQLALDAKTAPCYLDISAVVLGDSRQRVIGTLVMLRDISALKKAHLDIEALYDQEHKLRGSLEEEINKRSQYSRAIVHELRTPLTSIIASSDLLEGEVKDPVQLKLVQNILRSSLNLAQRVNELFELARGELGLIKINPVSFDINVLIQELTSELGPVAAGKGVLLKAEISPDELTVVADRDRLRQVIVNLLSNAVKFTNQGEIILRARPYEPGFILVQVEDTGCGIDPEQLNNLFDPYRRKSKEEGPPGLGLGLALSKILVELHQGKIWAESEAGKGAIISFIVPVKAEVKGN
jgi:signal transduction histidine kinase